MLIDRFNWFYLGEYVNLMFRVMDVYVCYIDWSCNC